MDSEKRSIEDPVMDEQAALEALDGSRELLSELAVIFSEDVDHALEELEQAVASRDAVHARRAAHTVKGLAATFFAAPTMDVARRLEHEAALGDLTTLRDGGIAQLRSYVAELVDELKRHDLLGDGKA